MIDKLTIDEVIEHCEKTVDCENRSIMRGGRSGGKMYYTKRYLEHLQVGEWLTELKKYRNLEEQGLLLKLPCKIGSTVYSIEQECEGDYISCMAHECDDCDCLYRFIEENAFDTYMMDSLGKTVFLTKEEAEQELKKLECAE